MHNDLARNESAARTGTPPGTRDQRRWSTRIAAIVLLVQTLILGAISAFLVSQVDWTVDLADAGFSADLLQTGGFLLFAVPIGLLLVVSAVLCLALPNVGWITAMIVQCMVLFLALSAYFVERLNITRRPWLLYVLILSAILVIVFLKSPEGRLLLVRRAQPSMDDRDA